MKKLYGLLCLVLLLAGCASDKNVSDNMSAEDLYNQAYEDLEATRYQKAAEGFEKVETDHPYSKWAVKAKLMGAYAYYKDEKYDDAILAADRFITYHPGNKDAPYAYYLKGMCYYDQISAADKDQGDTEKAEETFRRLIALYPNSKYAKDAEQKINLTEDYRAGQEMIIGRYYLKNNNYLSALNRFNVVLENYQTTIQIEEALYREVEIYAIFGMNKYADGYYKILKQNYPDGQWTAKAEKIMQKINQKGEKAITVQPSVQGKDLEKNENISEVKDEKPWWKVFTWGDDEKNVTDVKEVQSAKKEDAEKDEKPWWQIFSWGDGTREDADVKEIKQSAESEEKRQESTLLSVFGWEGNE